VRWALHALPTSHGQTLSKAWQQRHSGVLWGTLGYSRVLWGSLGYSGALWGTLGYSTVLWGTLGHSGVLWGTLRYSGVLWGTLGYAAADAIQRCATRVLSPSHVKSGEYLRRGLRLCSRHAPAQYAHSKRLRDVACFIAHAAMPHGAVAQRMPHAASCRLAPTNKTGDYERHTDVPYGSVVARHYECSCA
jgi:hypothetical protein